MISIFKRPKKASDSGSDSEKIKTEYLLKIVSAQSEKIEFLVSLVLALQKSDARLRQDVRLILREELKTILDRRERQAGVFAV